MANQLGGTFFLRGVLAPWGHPLYTSMTGIGFGIARETDKTWVRYMAPLGGYLAGVTLHAIWNGAASISSAAFLLLLPLWLLFVAGFGVILIWLFIRTGRTLAAHP